MTNCTLEDCWEFGVIIMRKIVALLLVIFLAIAFQMVGCSNEAAPPAQGEKTHTILVTDSYGRQVAVPEKVERIACLWNFAGYAVGLLGRGADLVAVQSGIKRDVLFRQLVPEILDAAVPKSSGAINIEELMLIKPDLVIIRGVTDEKELEKLEKSQIPFLFIEFTNIFEQQQAMSIIGKAIGCEREATDYNNYYQEIIAKIEHVVKDIPEDERIKIYHAEKEATRTISEDSLAADWSRLTGCINVSVGEDIKISDNNYYASLEQILYWDPEVIICNEKSARDIITANPQWSGIQAVQDGKVYQLPQGISRWGHPNSVETPLVMLWMAKTVYPEKFIHINMEEEVRNFYRIFFQVELDDAIIEQILSGEGLRDP